MQRLRDTIRNQEEKLQQRTTPNSENQAQVTPVTEPAALELELDGDDGHQDPPDLASTAQGELPLSPATELAPGPAFESRVRSIFRDHAGSSQSQESSPANQTVVSLRLEDPSSAQWRNVTDLLNDVPPPILLPRERSYQLFEAFVSLLGVNQHFIDSRRFSDELDRLYLNDSTRIRQMGSIWFTEYLLVMAVAMLIGSTSDGSDKPPGNNFFAESIRRLPPMHQLGSHGILSVEILCLITLYLQWCDRKHDAYLYIGSAVRLAIALGCSLPHSEQTGLTSEICHRNRVWWTAYMLDRRLSAGLGLPTGADDRQLRADLPKGSAGFHPPLPMILNIRIARATGEIMTSFYGNATITQNELVKKIRQTLQSLYETGKSIPSAFSIEFSDSQLTVTRTSASLYLMLYQAIILCIRPIILQCVKEKVQSSKENCPQAPMTSVVSRLTQSCLEAASKSIQILSSLKKDKTIALFGYFDLDATFSAAFVLVMMGFIRSDDPKNPPEGLLEAAEVLQYLSNAGNKAAQQRFHELQVFCSHVWSPDDMSEDWRWLKNQTMEVQSSEMIDATVGTCDVSVPQEGLGEMSIASQSLSPWLNARSIGLTSSEHGGVALDFDIPDALGFDLIDQAGDIYSCFNDPNLPLTGVDEVDWAEIGKIFQSNPP